MSATTRVDHLGNGAGGSHHNPRFVGPIFRVPPGVVGASTARPACVSLRVSAVARAETDPSSLSAVGYKTPEEGQLDRGGNYTVCLQFPDGRWYSPKDMSGLPHVLRSPERVQALAGCYVDRKDRPRCDCDPTRTPGVGVDANGRSPAEVLRGFGVAHLRFEARSKSRRGACSVR